MNATHITLPSRLMMVSNLLGMGNVIADVGCDHGYLPISLIESGRYTRAIAMDINKGPLSKASDNIAKAGLSDIIDVRLSDGVKGLNLKEADAVSICGMGGNVMMHIFDEGLDVLSHADKVVIQPQSEYMALHNYVRLKGYTIEEEDVAFEDGKYYFAWKLRYTGEELHGIIEKKMSFYYSEELLERGDKTYLNYLKRNYELLSKAIENIEANSDKTDRLEKLCEERQLIEESVGV